MPSDIKTPAWISIYADTVTIFLQSHELLKAGKGLAVEIVNEEIAKTLLRHTDELGKRVDKLTANTNERLREISGQVDKRLTEGFEKTQATFSDVVKRLALIDDAQKKITELSGNVVSLQDLLIDKDDLNRIWILRKVLQPLNPVEGMEFLLDKLNHTPSNKDFLASMSK